MAMVNGKIVGSGAKKIKKALKHDKPLVEKAAEKKAKNPVRDGWEEFKNTELKRPNEEKPKKAKKKTRVETSEPEMFRIQIGQHSYLSVELTNDDNGSPVVAVRKWYNTKNDSTIKPGRGGFNIQPKASELKLLAAKLKAIALEIEAGD